MTLRLTPDMLEGAYEFLRTTPPFRRWALPPADEVEFIVGREPRCRGMHANDGTHRIMISDRNIGHTINLVATMAHEMIHVHQSERWLSTRTEHNADFHRRARLVCRHHGFDPKLF
jgi:hypothetical protein